MKKVLHLNASASGGAFVVAQRLHQALNRSGKISSRHLVFEGNSGDYDLWANTKFKKLRAVFLHALEKLDFLRFEKNKAIRFAFSHGKTGIDLQNHPLVLEADIIHIHWINKGFLSLKNLNGLLALNKKIIWTTHDMWAYTGGCYHNRGCNHFENSCGNCHYLKNPSNVDLSHRVFEQKKAMYLKHPQLVFVSPSNWLATIGSISGIGISNKPIVIPNGIQSEVFKPRNREDLRTKYGYRIDQKIVLFIAGNLSNPYKGFGPFIEMMKMVSKQISTLKIVVIGGKKPELDFGNLSIDFVGSVNRENELAAWYSMADLYVTTSLEENLPTTPIESLCCNTPVAAFNVGGMGDIIIHGENGFLAPLNDVEMLAGHIIDYLLGTVVLPQPNDAISIQASAKFDIGKVAERYLELYDR